jgi:hypothetical protein
VEKKVKKTAIIPVIFIILLIVIILVVSFFVGDKAGDSLKTREESAISRAGGEAGIEAGSREGNEEGETDRSIRGAEESLISKPAGSSSAGDGRDESRESVNAYPTSDDVLKGSVDVVVPPSKECLRDPLEISVRALLDYESDRISQTIDDYFCWLERLHAPQKQALNDSLNLLEGKNFIVFNKQIEVLENESDVQVYSERNLIYLEVFDKEVSKGRVLLGDLSYIDMREDCSVYGIGGTGENPWDYVGCYIDEYTRDNSGVLIGEDQYLVDYIYDYFVNNIGNFENDYDFYAYDEEILIHLQGDLHPLIIYRYVPGTFNKTYMINRYKSYEERIFNREDTNSFFVVEQNLTEPMRISMIRLISESIQTTPPPTLPTLSFKGVIKKIIDFFINLFKKAEVTGEAIEEEEGECGVMDLTGSVDCEYLDQPGTGPVLPCNKKVEAFFGTPDEFVDETIVIKEGLNKLIDLGYDVGFYEVKSVSERYAGEIFDDLLESRGQIMYTQFHGGKEGSFGPVACSPALEYKKRVFAPTGSWVWQTIDQAAEARNWWDSTGKEFFGCECSAKVIELIDSGDSSNKNPYLFVRKIRKIPECNSDKFKLSFPISLFDHCSEEDEEGKGFRVSVYANRIDLGERAFQSGVNCYGHANKFTNLYSSYFANEDDVNSHRFIYNDVKILVDYLMGAGPAKTKWESSGEGVLSGDFVQKNPYDNYPPEVLKVHNNYVGDLEDFEPSPICLGKIDDGPCKVELTVDYICAHYPCWFADEASPLKNSEVCEEDLMVPCRQESRKDKRDVHLFPFVNSFYFVDNYKNLSIEFSDKVTKPEVKFILEDGTNAIRESEAPNSGDRFKYEIFSEMKVLTKNEWWVLTKEQKKEVKVGTITIRGSQADVGKNDVEMVGNPLAKLTEENDAHEQPFFLYDKYFWNYNARASGDDFRTFKARVPYMKHPWVTELRSYSPYYRNHIFVKFSHDINIIEEACNIPAVDVDIGECAFFYNEKPFNNETVKPKFVDKRTIEFTLRDRDPYSAVQFFISPTYDTWGSDVWLMETYGYDKSNWPEKWAVKIKIQNIKSVPNGFSLMGNTESPSFWDYDRDENGAADAWESNSNQVPQKKGAFEIWIPCMPAPSACRIPEQKVNGGGNTYLDYKCEDESEKQCTDLGGTFYKGSKCLENHYYGDPTPSGTINGRFPINCGLTTEAFILEKETTSSCNPDLDTSSIHHGYTRYENNGEGIWAAKLRYLDGYDRNYNFLARAYDFDCDTGFYSYGGGVSTLNMYPDEDNLPECETASCSASGSLSCDGGALTQTCGSPGCSTTTTASFSRICGSGADNPDGRYAAYYDRTTLQTECCDGNEQWGYQEDKCVPLSDEKYVSC